MSKFRIPVVGTDKGGATYAGFVPILNSSGQLSSTFFPPAIHSYIKNKCITMELPTNGDNFPIIYTPDDVLVQQVIAQVQGIPSSSATFNLQVCSNLNLIGVGLQASSIVLTADDGLLVLGQDQLDTLNINANKFLVLRMFGSTDTPTRLHVTVIYI